MIRSVGRVLAFCACLASVAAARAETIDFSGQPRTGFPVFLTDTEGHFTTTAYSGIFNVGDRFGDPVPDLFVNAASATIDVKRNNGGLFSFSSVDFSSLTTGSYLITGLLGTSQVFSQAGAITSAAFSTFNTLYAGYAINDLHITLTNTTSEADLDNINVTIPNATAPEPSSLMLLGTGVLGVAGAVRRRLSA